MSEIYEHIRRIAEILNARQPNQAELKQRENSMKKCVAKLDPVALIVTFKDTVVELVLSLQLVERAAMCKHFSAQWDKPLLSLVIEILASTEINPVIRRHSISIASVLCVKRFRPGSLITFLKNSGLSDADTLDALGEITSVTPLTDEERHLIGSWANELWPLISSTNNIELIEKWVKFVPGETLRNSGFISNISIRDVHHFEEVLLACCDKQELVQDITSICSQLLASGQLEFATRLFGELKSSINEWTLSVIASIKEILVSNRVLNLHTRLRMIENTLGFFEQKHVLLDMPLYQTLLILSAVPPEVDNKKFWINFAETDLDDETSDLGLYDRFMEIRQEVRHILRSCSFASDDMHGNVLSLVLNSMSSPDWRLTESVLHAFSAQQKRYAKEGGQILTQLFSVPDPAISLHRAVSNAIIICGTTFFASIPENQLDCVMQFVILCLRAIDTVDESGWLPFRAKQDNSCVVLLLNLAGSRHKLNFNLFVETLIPAIDEIKQRLYYRDMFRQSRDLFVKAVADIIMRHSADPKSVLFTMFVKVCDDCRDVSLFLNQTTSLKHLLLPAIEPKLQTFLQRNSDGVESIIARYSDCLSLDQILGCLELSRKSSDFAPNRWIAQVETISSVHGGQFVVNFSILMNNQPVKFFTLKWFTYCLPLVGIDTHKDQEFHISWISRITKSIIEPDSFKAAMTYCATTLVKISQPEIVLQLGVLLTRRIIREVSTIHSNESISILECFGKIIGWTSLHAVLLSSVPRMPTDAKLLVDALSHNEYGKARRIMKKMIIDI